MSRRNNHNMTINILKKMRTIVTWRKITDFASLCVFQAFIINNADNVHTCANKIETKIDILFLHIYLD